MWPKDPRAMSNRHLAIPLSSLHDTPTFSYPPFQQAYAQPSAGQQFYHMMGQPQQQPVVFNSIGGGALVPFQLPPAGIVGETGKKKPVAKKAKSAAATTKAGRTKAQARAPPKSPKKITASKSRKEATTMKVAFEINLQKAQSQSKTVKEKNTKPKPAKKTGKAIAKKK